MDHRNLFTVFRKHIGLCGDALNFIVSYFSDRKQQVRIDNIMSQQTMVCRFGSVVQTTSESSADRLKVGRTSESNWILIFGNNSDDCKRNQCSPNFQVILWHNFSIERLVKVVWIDRYVHIYKRI